jgi:ABC-type phosphate transport system permease subunit
VNYTANSVSLAMSRVIGESAKLLILITFLDTCLIVSVR